MEAVQVLSASSKLKNTQKKKAQEKLKRADQQRDEHLIIPEVYSPDKHPSVNVLELPEMRKESRQKQDFVRNYRFNAAQYTNYR